MRTPDTRTVILMILPTIIAILLYCGRKSEVVKVQSPLPPDVEIKTCGNSKTGDFHKLECPIGEQGSIVEVCSDSGEWTEVTNTCNDPECDPNSITFEKIKPIIVANCANQACHPRYVNYDVSRLLAYDMLRRIQLLEGQDGFMPRIGGRLDDDDIDLFRLWIDDGIKESINCNLNSSVDFIELDYVEKNILRYIESINEDDVPYIGYINFAQVFNRGDNVSDAKKAIDKMINTISFDNEITKCGFIDEKKTICAYDFRNYKLDLKDFRIINKNTTVNFVSNTTRGRIIRGLTVNDTPWLHAEDFIDILNKKKLYYSVMGFSDDFNEYLNQSGADLNLSLANLDVKFIGLQESVISGQKQRLIVEIESEVNGIDGVCWVTRDPIALDADNPERNLSVFPFLDGLGSNKIFDFVAGEAICDLPNGLQSYYIANVANERLDCADITVVIDVLRPHIDPEICIVTDCMSCHASGYLPATDEIGKNILSTSAGQFENFELDLIRQIYINNNQAGAAFAADNKRYRESLSKLDINPNDPDPVTSLWDVFLLNQNLKQVSAFLLLPENEMIDCIKQSARLQIEVGSLIEGGSITHDQFIESLPIFFNDCNDILNDPLGT